MEYNLKLKEGEIKLLFSIRFLDVLCKMTGNDISDIFQYIIGKNIKVNNDEGKTIKIDGGLINSLDVRAAVIAAGVETYRLKNKEGKGSDIEEGFDLIEQMESPLLSETWGKMYGVLMECLIPQLPKEKKKKS